MDIDIVAEKIQQFTVETPSWGYGDSGKRFTDTSDTTDTTDTNFFRNTLVKDSMLWHMSLYQPRWHNWLHALVN